MLTLALALAVGTAAIPDTGAAQVFLTQEEALALAFPDATGIVRETAFLNEEQAAAVEELTGASLDRRVATYYAAHGDGGWLGVAWFDAHRVRTLEEVLMVVVSPAGAVQRLEVLKFAEPRDYLAPDGWMDQFTGRALSDDLDLKGDIVNMTGATLTSRAVTDAVRRVLAVQAVVDPMSKPAPGADGGDTQR
jgi:hypothetical protein